MGFELTALVVIDTDYTGSCKSNYHNDTIITTTAPAVKEDKKNNVDKIDHNSIPNRLE